MGIFEERLRMENEKEKEKIILEIFELQRERLEELNEDELKEVRKTFTNDLGYCECGNTFKNEIEEEIGFCEDCR